MIELLMVILIMLILFGIVVGMSRYVSDKALQNQTIAELHTMEVSLEAYKADQGAYPPLDAAAFNNMNINLTGSANYYSNPAWTSSAYIYRALTGSNNPSGKVYMTFNSRQHIIFNNTDILLDPRGNPWGYNPLAPIANPKSFDLFSVGKDGISGYTTNSALVSQIYSITNDDIGNWQR